MTERESETGISRPVRIAVLAVAAGLVAWFFFAWLALDRHVLDAAGESVGSGLLLLVIVSIVGVLLKRS
ncbi:hypothetical protein [Allorhizocola rhizosphaerae]|uniref:hypothetical protein n=1 Tax=Allorhizocola rhizosphaerae TaxID=1872709 RepID=UPI000E3D3BFA|nr:hypothetical protein [Allorhizocola rhizosphaerae]